METRIPIGQRISRFLEERYVHRARPHHLPELLVFGVILTLAVSADVLHGSDGVGDDEISLVFHVVSCRRAHRLTIKLRPHDGRLPPLCSETVAGCAEN